MCNQDMGNTTWGLWEQDAPATLGMPLPFHLACSYAAGVAPGPPVGSRPGWNPEIEGRTGRPVMPGWSGKGATTYSNVLRDHIVTYYI